MHATDCSELSKDNSIVSNISENSENSDKNNIIEYNCEFCNKNGEWSEMITCRNWNCDKYMRLFCIEKKIGCFAYLKKKTYIQVMMKKSE